MRTTSEEVEEIFQSEDGVTVLFEKPSEDFEPEQEEINNYAEWLGMHPVEDAEFLWLAREGLKAPLPPGWKPCQDPEGNIFYFNFETGESSWDHPADTLYRKRVFEEKRRKAERSVAHQASPRKTAAASPLLKAAPAAGGFRCTFFRRCCRRRPRLPT
eukprot:TRINITY_DN4542_c0_g1_i1.p1 TRINITY_DN4542_c0_g1~~TRINITY_DN4542_c0_g1_i1.p1  ORF type:complete len:158 (-),score=32.07 TRINITY_DN4542_c0_g1_i1:109-582(-)